MRRRREFAARRTETWTTDFRLLLQRAAAAWHKNITEFLLDAGIHAAKETLAHRRLFRLDEAQWKAFQEVLDRSVVAKPHFARLLSEKSVLE